MSEEEKNVSQSKGNVAGVAYGAGDMAKEQQQMPERVSGATIQKKSFLQKMSSVFFEDTLENVAQHAYHDILIPSIVDTICNIIHDSVDRIFRNDGRGNYISRSNNGRLSGGTRTETVSYNSMYGRNQQSSTYHYSGKKSMDIGVLIIEPDVDNSGRIVRRADLKAFDLRDELFSLNDRFGKVTVADIKNRLTRSDGSAEVPAAVDNDWGWYDLDDQNTVITRGRGDVCFLNLPDAEYLR